jgi:LPXTG-site transpeptidase (sortase) family protein
VARIVIPRLGLDTATYEGSTLATIDLGPSHITGTAKPGHAGNTVFAGHRTTKTHPFRYLDRLEVGDTATFVTSQGRFTYEYQYTDYVTEDGVEILRQGTGYTATIFACHPPGSDAYRIVTHWRLVSAAAARDESDVQATGGADPSAAPSFGTGKGGGSGYLGPATTTTTTPSSSPPASSGSTTPTTTGSLKLPGR